MRPGQAWPLTCRLPSSAEPNLLINAVIISDDKVITAQKSLKVPLVERTLTITAKPNKTQYLPGEKGQLRCAGGGLASGKPVEADLSFGEVDEALYSVRPDAEPARSGPRCPALAQAWAEPLPARFPGGSELSQSVVDTGRAMVERR